MAKVIIEFDSIEDKDEMEMCLHGSKLYSLAWELDQYFRSRMKYENDISEDTYNAVESARAKLRELMRENGLTFD
jgi:K+-transporting ATPase c subunit